MTQITINFNEENSALVTAMTTILAPIEGANAQEKLKNYIMAKILSEVNGLITQEAKDATTPTLIEDTEIS